MKTDSIFEGTYIYIKMSFDILCYFQNDTSPNFNRPASHVVFTLKGPKKSSHRDINNSRATDFDGSRISSKCRRHR